MGTTLINWVAIEWKEAGFFSDQWPKHAEKKTYERSPS